MNELNDCLYYTFYAPFILAPIGLIKGLIFGLPACAVATICTACIVMAFLPYHVFLAAKIVWTTAYLGPNVRFLLLLLFFPVSVVAYPVISVLVTFLLCFGINVFGIGATVFPEDCTTHKSILHHYKETVEWVEHIYKLARHEFPRVAPDLCYVPQNWDGQIYEISVAKLVVGAVLLVYGTVVGLVLIFLIGIVKFPYTVFRSNKEYIRLCLVEWKCYWFIFEVVGFVLMNGLLLPLCLCVAVPIYGLVTGARCVAEALRTDSMKEGFRESLRITRHFDQWTTCIIVFEREKDQEECFSCIPAVSERIHLEVTERLAANAEVDMEDIFHNFERLGLNVVNEASRREWIRESDVLDLEPFLMIGIPALMAFDIVMCSVKESRGKEEIVCQPDVDSYYGSASEAKQRTRTVTSETKPKHGIAFVFWPKIMKCKRIIENAGDLTTQEIEWLRCKLLTNGADHVTEASKGILGGLPDEKQRDELTRSIASAFNSLAIDTSRLQRTGQMIAHISENATKTGDRVPLGNETTVERA